jgi:prepilin-type N-terminal cleavage/methylation domain-containing protein
MKQISQIGNNRNGFTFIEVLVSVSLLAVGVLLVFNSYFTTLSAMRRSADRIQARFILEQERCDFLRTIRSNKYITENKYETKVVGVDPEYHLTLRFDKILNLDNLYGLSLSVEWIASGKNFTLSSAVWVRQLIL